MSKVVVSVVKSPARVSISSNQELTSLRTKLKETEKTIKDIIVGVNWAAKNGATAKDFKEWEAELKRTDAILGNLELDVSGFGERED